MPVLEQLAAIILLLGACFMLVASVGVLRMPDLFMRMSAASKGASLGAGLALTAVAVHFTEAQVTARVLATIVFVFLTVPVAAHMVARAGYLSGAPISERTRIDELKEHYAAGSRERRGGP